MLTLDQASIIVDKALEKGRECGFPPPTVTMLDAGGQLNLAGLLQINAANHQQATSGAHSCERSSGVLSGCVGRCGNRSYPVLLRMGNLHSLHS